LEGVANENSFAKIRKDVARLEREEEKRMVAVPLAKTEKDRQLRKTQYENTSQEVSKWVHTVNTMHASQNLKFPLKKPDYHKPIVITSTNTTGITPISDLEKQLASVLDCKSLFFLTLLRAFPFSSKRVFPSSFSFSFSFSFTFLTFC
jgi:U3 small nucleolar RNA-associated protein 14